MINNRQGGRRRGRGGQRGPNLGGQPGNRQDNRQRGNAAQLLEKYKSMARDSQLAGDRVQTEYYLQYADHYFRVVNENRARFEDQNPRRQHADSDEDEGEEDLVEAGESEDSGDDRAERAERQDRGDRQDRGERRDRRPRDRNRYDRDDQAASGEDEDRRPRAGRMNGGDDGDAIPLDVLPPAIGADGPATSLPGGEPDERPAPRRRSRGPRPAADDDGEVAPAA